MSVSLSLSKVKIEKFQQMIFSWWRSNRRDLPWRTTHDPYRILISEVMLQQTQVSRVTPKYHEFLTRFPTLATLAQSRAAEVIRVWKGMGYNRRAIYLKRAAESLMNLYGGTFPKNEADLVKLPGLGTYTARAILVFAFQQNIALVDTNIRKIISYFFFEGQLQKESILWDTATRILPHGRSWEWHQALMDYGAAESSKFKMKNSKLKEKKIPFRGSTRYYRGRIMDFLRERNYSERELIGSIHVPHTQTTKTIVHILDGLIRDGLIIRKGRILSLPE